MITSTAHVVSSQQKAVLRIVRNLAIFNGAVIILIGVYAYTHSMPWDEMIPLLLTSVCKRRSKNRSYDAARAGYYGGVKVDHRRRLSFMSCCGTAEFMEHRKGVQGGALRSCAACGSKRCGGLFPALSLAVSLSCSHCVIYRSLVGQASPNLVAASIATRSPDSENEPLRSVKSSKIV